MFSNSTNDISETGGLFTEKQSKFTTTYTMERTANHTEISIMKTQWNNICKKVNLIHIKKFTFNIQEIIIGAAIPYIIDVLSDWHAKKTPSYFPIFICFVLLLIATFAKKYIPLCNDHSGENEIHLSDIKDIIAEIDKKDQNSQT